MNIKEIEKLAELSKIDLSEEEKQSLLKEIDSILSYVSDVQKVAGEKTVPIPGPHFNILREDSDPYPPEMFTKAILENAPHTKDGFVKVKKIL
ncbi:MAG TPA: Asp-tRNA(Asn)/Glu-tRNA(Gln) amidotransferase subunit GatC [Candidatus Paceibacterota bacterium]|nr:Asp-tRNA(Asn)/Glu-tRNA(Gln) amidotransferase subunit GatC [Candidatus Paceibacterota bacterium]